MTDEFRGALGRAEERLATKQEELFDRLEKSLGRLEARVEHRLDTMDKDTQREFAEARRDIGELRDLVNKQGDRIDEMETGRTERLMATAEGAARGAGAAAGAVAAQTAQATAQAVAKGFWATWLGKMVAAAVGFTALVTGASAMPAVARTIERVWHFITNSK